MSTLIEGGPVNGHLSPEHTIAIQTRNVRDRSESDASDTRPESASENGHGASPTSSDDALDATHIINGDQYSQDSDGQTPDNASDDADFDMQDSPVSHPEDAVEEHSSSSDSSRALKRRATAREDDFIQANPQLYGLRRSQRPQQPRKTLASDNSEEDVVPANRRASKRRRVDNSRPSSIRPTPSHQPSTDESESDSDNYGGARAKRSQKKARLERESQPNLVEKRWSNRRTAQRVTYEESDFEVEEEDDMAPEDFTADYVDESPYIEKVVKHQTKDHIQLSYDLNRNDFLYFIKWQGRSHLHDSWNSLDSLRDMRGFRKVENYYRKVVEQELDMRFGDEVPLEMREQFFLDRERDEEALEDFTKAERVVAVRDGEDETEYYVKWKGLTYEECTWEKASDISPAFQDKIDQFLDRSSRSWQSNRKESNKDTRSRMVKLDKQPDYIQGVSCGPSS
uniref:Chromo domain-containing protein n=1 Tax=Bionectria ochroleuca TaxID=29856 RepID=A0A8H7TLF8_BIOOC